MSGSGVASVFPEGGRRLVVYVVYDRRGEVEDFVVHALGALRGHASHVMAVVNGSLSEEGRAKLEPVADSVLVRGNRGYDIWAHKDALAQVADLSSYDEVVLTNDTWFGPVRDFAPVFERMNARAVDFWGMTDFAEEVPNPFTNEGRLPYHVQSFWIAVRSRMFLSEQWLRYWDELPEMPDYFDAVLKHEAVFTEHFTDRGFTVDVAFPYVNYPTGHPALFNADLLVEDGCPLLKRRPLFHYPPFLDRHAVIGRWTLETVEKYGYPMPLLWSNLARNVPPRVLNTDAAMLEVLPDIDTGAYDPSKPFRIAVIAHIRDIALLDELLDRVTFFPDESTIVLTVLSVSDADAARVAVERRGMTSGRVEVRVVESDAGRDMSAAFVGCADVLNGPFDLVARLHTMKRDDSQFNARRYLRRHQFENLAAGADYVRNILALFQREPGLGVVFPPTVHVGHATLGHAWAPYRDDAARLCEQLGVRVPLDGSSPLAPLGGMWVSRPAALRLLTERGWTFEDYATSRADLDRVQERVIAYVAGESGFHCRTVLNREHAAISHTALEEKVDQMFSTTPGYPVEQIQFLHRAGWAGHGGPFSIGRMYLRMNHPRVSHAVEPALGVAARVAGRARRVRDRLLRRSTAASAVEGARL